LKIYGDRQRNMHRSDYQTEKEGKVVHFFYSINEEMTNFYTHRQQYPEEKSNSYKRLFETVIKGDLAKVEEMTLKKKKLANNYIFVAPIKLVILAHLILL